MVYALRSIEICNPQQNGKTKTKNTKFQNSYCSYTGQSVVVNEIFPPLPKYDSSSDDDSEVQSTTDEGITSDDELQFGTFED